VILFGLIAIPVLIAVNAFFTAAEYSLVAVRKTRVEELVQKGVRRARSVAFAKSRLDRSIAATQLGITLASIALGAVGESVLATFLQHVLTFIPERLGPLTAHSVAAILAIVGITYVHVILGEQIPKIVVIYSPDRVALRTAWFLNGFARVTSPILRLMNATTHLILRQFGYSRADMHHQVASVEELRMLVEDTQEAGLIEEDTAVFVQNVFRLTDKTVRDCMIPKEKMDALEVHTPTAKVLAVVRRSGHTRLPVYDGEIDNIVGILNTKHLFSLITLGQVVILEDVLYPATFILPDETVSVALRLFKKTRRPMAIVRDAEKHVLGMLTLEDVLEEIVGDIEDEHDVGGPRAVEHLRPKPPGGPKPGRSK
jgi:CBS domain containing-hemolysin-like protein